MLTIQPRIPEISVRCQMEQYFPENPFGKCGVPSQLSYVLLNFCLDILEFCHSVLWQHYCVVWFLHYVVRFCHYVTRFAGYVLCYHHDVLRSSLDVLCL